MRLFLYGLFLFGSVSHAQKILDAEAEVDTLVVHTDFELPLQQLELPQGFANFRYPYVDEHETVTFIANDPYKLNVNNSSEFNGIYRSTADGSIQALVTQGEPAPDDQKPFGPILGLRTDLQSWVFAGGGHGARGLYGLFGSTSAVAPVASHGMPAPNGRGTFDWFYYGDVARQWVVFQGTVKLSDEESTQGLYLFHAPTQQRHRLIDDTCIVPHLGCQLKEFSKQPSIDPHWLVFAASPQSDGAANAPTRGVYGWPLQNLNDSFQPPELQDLAVLLEPGMVIPEVEEQQVTHLFNPLSRNGILATVVACDQNEVAHPRRLPTAYQALLVRDKAGTWHNPLDTLTINPFANDSSCFTEINQWLAICEDRVIFRAMGAAGYEAIYLYDVTSRTLYFLLDNRRMIQDKTVLSFETSNHPLIGNRLSFMARFTDDTAAIYIATLPGLPVQTKRR